MIRRLSRSTFAFVSSLIRQGRVNGGRGLSSQTTKKKITGSESETKKPETNTCKSSDTVTEKTPLLTSSSGSSNRDPNPSHDVENQTEHLKSDLLNSLAPSPVSMSCHKEDLEAIVVTDAATEDTDLSPAAKRLRHDPPQALEAVVTIVDETAGRRSPCAAQAQDSEDPSTPESHVVKDSKRKGMQPQSKSDTLRLNYFVAIQIKDSEIRNKIQQVQSRILEAETVPVKSKGHKGLNSISGNLFKETMVPVEKLHFTLHVVHLKDEEDKEKAKRILEKVGRDCQADFEQKPMVAKIGGLGHMRNTVIFAKLDGEEEISRLTSLADKLRQEFESVNITGETRSFKPHMTVAKMSRSKKLYRKNIKAFPRELWSEMESMEFGSQEVTGIQLLSMQDKPDSAGYYRALAEFHFNSNLN